MDGNTLLKFGIPGFDGLFNNLKPETSHGGRNILNPDFNNCGIYLPGRVSSSICIIGPDGVGKSVFALHLASRYSAECQRRKVKPLVFYISTDLNHEIAKEMWRNFGLGTPAADRDPFSKNSGIAGAETVELKTVKPDGLEAVLTSPPTNSVIFVDLAAHTAGDDWGFLHRFLAVLEKKPGAENHLVIIDAVEGFETYVGEMDAFGERTSRRARIAQIMRLAKDKSHLLLVVEESRSNERLPEEFVTDVVIRLHKTSFKGYIRRTVEVEKARGQHYARGPHHYTIRNGKGSTTGTEFNADDPEFKSKRLNANEEETDWEQSYVFMPHSLHYFHRTIMERVGPGKPGAPINKYNSFGIEYLDNMLGGEYTEITREGGYDTRGLPCGTITALVGDTMTQKSHLGRAFLSQAFSSVVDIYREMENETTIRENASAIYKRLNNLCDFGKAAAPAGFAARCIALIQNSDWKNLVGEFKTRIDGLLKKQPPKKEAELLRKKLKWLQDLQDKFLGKSPSEITEISRDWLIKNDNGVAVMITTNDLNNDVLVERFASWLKPKYGEDDQLRDLLVNYMKLNTICRRIEIHDVSSSTMVSIFSKTLWKAQKNLLGEQQFEDPLAFDRLGRIRLVIDDFSNFRTIYSDITDDPLLLPSIKFLLGRSSVTTLIIDTQTGKPDIAVGERFASELRQMVDHSLYTWRVPFYGENRVAISAIPPLSSDNAGIVRELTWETRRDEANPLNVDPHFEMYLGLEEGKPEPIPLEVRLFSDVSYFDSYIDEENLLFSEIFVPARSVSGEKTDRIIVKFPNTKYDFMRNMSYLQRDTRLDHTAITGVDEFWGTKLPDRRRSGAFRPLWNYLNSVTRRGSLVNKDTDPYALFQKGVVGEKNEEPVKRRRFYFDDDLGYNFVDLADEAEQSGIERVPFSWDFGFIVCKTDAWLRAANKGVEIIIGKDQEGKEITKKHTVHEIWDRLIKIPAMKQSEDQTAKTPPEDHPPAEGEPLRVNWRIFLDACKNVAEAESDRLGKKVPAFDSSMVTPETFSCLFLEVWASEIFEKFRRKNAVTKAAKFLNLVANRRWSNNKREESLIDWIRDYRLELYKTWLLLVDVLDFSGMSQNSYGNFEFNTRLASQSAVAVRFWYKTACHWIESNQHSEPLTAIRLPGNFSVRGDWFLSIAGGSRSPRLGERALDILCSRRANIVRLQQGLGLPTRYLENNDELRTRLVLNGRYGKPQNLPYKDLKSIGQPPDSKDFHWFWRSSLNDYHRHSRAWHKWLNRVLLWWSDKKLRYESSWDPGFKSYDLISAGLDTRTGEDKVRSEFLHLCDILTDELANASTETGPGEPPGSRSDGAK